MHLPVDDRVSLSLAVHPAFLPLLAKTDIRVTPTSTSPFGVRLMSPGQLEVQSDLLGDEGGLVEIRFGLEFAWLACLPGLTRCAAAVLAARAAGCFAGLPGMSKNRQPTPAVFDSLTGQVLDGRLVASACRILSTSHGGDDKLTRHDLACIEALWPVALPTECLLASGGDERLLLDPETGFNRYGCTPWPRPDVVAFGSCTASSLSIEAFAAAEAARQTLASAMLRTAPSVALAEMSDGIAASLLDYYDVADLADAVLAASGTDAALVVTGLLAAEHPNEFLTSILMSPSETGSGVPDAVQGRHFASSSAAGCKVGKGQPIEGLTLGPQLETVPLRHGSGLPLTSEEVAEACDAAIRAGVLKGRVVLHAIDGSKTGLTAPDRNACRQLANTYGERLDIVVDACQARIDPALVRWYLQQGFPVLVTGSKFFAAPGFCGAVLFPQARLRRIAKHGRLPAGLAPYARVEGGFGSRRCAGLVLRWHAALHEMNSFARLDANDIRARLQSIQDVLTKVLFSDDRFGLVQAPRPDGPGWSGQRSVFTFTVESGTGRLDTASLRRFYTAMNTDASVNAGVGQRRIAAQLCQIGQPVDVGSSLCGGLRIAISAAQIVSGDRQQGGLEAVADKLRLLLDAEAAGRRLVAAVRTTPVVPALPRVLTG